MDCWVKKRNRLKDTSVIKRVMYEHMTDDSKIGRYNTVEPWRLFGGGDDDRLDVDKMADLIAYSLVSRVRSRDRDIFFIVQTN
jgi:hypothetical protein